MFKLIFIHEGKEVKVTNFPAWPRAGETVTLNSVEYVVTKVNWNFDKGFELKVYLE